MNKTEKHLESIDVSKRDTIRTLVRTAAFTAPVVASFAVDGKLTSSLAGAVSMSNS